VRHNGSARRQDARTCAAALDGPRTVLVPARQPRHQLRARAPEGAAPRAEVQQAAPVGVLPPAGGAGQTADSHGPARPGFALQAGVRHPRSGGQVWQAAGAAGAPSRTGPCLAAEGRASSRTAGWPTTTCAAPPGVSGPAMGRVGHGRRSPMHARPASQAAGPALAGRLGHRAPCAYCDVCQDSKIGLCLLSAMLTGPDAGRGTGGQAARARARQQRLGARDGHIEALGVAPEGQVGRRAARARRGRPRQRLRPRQHLRPGRRRPLDTFGAQAQHGCITMCISVLRAPMP